MRLIKVAFYIFIAILVFIFSSYVTMKIILKAQRTVICPDIIGKNVEEAKRLVESSGLYFHIVRYEKRNDIPYNHITVQKPGANILTKKGRTVMVIVSDGPELLIVPNIEGQPVNDAYGALKEKNINVEKIIYVPNENEGKVIAQIPRGGEGLLEGKGIVIFAGSKPKRYILMPDIGNIDLTEIKEELTKKNIGYKIIQRGDYSMPRRQRIIPSIAPGQVFDADEGLEIKINLGEEEDE
ncbi:MAG TPA: PASTA domain-containing protein [Syntrophorhabdaceae bacterium]|nr:PASTA domain-containing protein [Syntrophorhabdaceae bacterium]HOT42621.1 PASTA domain-containing protein [Syntrophorhabdaceae bacterium]HQK46031.1 PASTA domain-containing protein [Syntrophorhabdaceae bacterium]